MNEQDWKVRIGNLKGSLNFLRAEKEDILAQGRIILARKKKEITNLEGQLRESYNALTDAIEKANQVER